MSTSASCTVTATASWPWCRRSSAPATRVNLADPSVIRIDYSPVNLQHVDLFLWTESDGILTTSFDPDLAWPGMFDEEAFPVTYIGALEAVKLHGSTFPAPSPVGRFLAEHRFGPDYMTPARPVLSGQLYPDIAPEQLTPAVKTVLARLVLAEARLRELKTRSRLSQAGPWRRWIDSGLPSSPPPALVADVLAVVPAQERTATVEDLAVSIARQEHAIQELQRRSPVRMVRRAVRRGAWLSQRLRG